MTTSNAPTTTTSRKPDNAEVDVYGLTHQGKVRKTNQDHFLICSLDKTIHVHQTSLAEPDKLPLRGDRLAFLAMVADGVGGGTGGEVASRIAQRTSEGRTRRPLPLDLSRLSRDAKLYRE